jgi:hypothetical protein
MKDIVDAIIEGNGSKIKDLIHSRLYEIARLRADMMRLSIVAEQYGAEDDGLLEANVMRTGRTKLIRVRVRGGKIQRRKKFSAVKGYTIRRGKMVRMSALEKRHRAVGARRAKIKRRTKMSQMLRKRKISLRKRTALGIK